MQIHPHLAIFSTSAFITIILRW